MELDGSERDGSRDCARGGIFVEVGESDSWRLENLDLELDLERFERAIVESAEVSAAIEDMKKIP